MGGLRRLNYPEWLEKGKRTGQLLHHLRKWGTLITGSFSSVSRENQYTLMISPDYVKSVATVMTNVSQNLLTATGFKNEISPFLIMLLMLIVTNLAPAFQHLCHVSFPPVCLPGQKVGREVSAQVTR